MKSTTTIICVVEEEANGEGPSNAVLHYLSYLAQAIKMELRRHLGTATEEIVPMTVPTPMFPDKEFDFPSPPRMTELAVRSWGDILLPGQPPISSSSSASGSDEVTHTLANFLRGASGHQVTFMALDIPSIVPYHKIVLTYILGVFPWFGRVMELRDMGGIVDCWVHVPFLAAWKRGGIDYFRMWKLAPGC
ncbi:hypothetical protein BDQ17DRAFT_1428196 [Cyathus striatus]|nr:hypothetical protein BDQ17DRAFT_1428196 [Cyathus striatus]